MEQTMQLQESLLKAQTQIDALSIPGLWEFQNYGWEMIKNDDGTFTMKPSHTVYTNSAIQSHFHHCSPRKD